MNQQQIIATYEKLVHESVIEEGILNWLVNNGFELLPIGERIRATDQFLVLSTDLDEYKDVNFETRDVQTQLSQNLAKRRLLAFEGRLTRECSGTTRNNNTVILIGFRKAHSRPSYLIRSDRSWEDYIRKEQETQSK